jgi:hypothetical protein
VPGSLGKEGGTLYRTDRKERFRYRLSLDIPLLASEKLLIEGFNEIWLNLFEPSRAISLNQNWIYGGLAYRFMDGGKIGVGYMNLWAPRGPESSIRSHIVQTTLSFDLDLTN